MPSGRTHDRVTLYSVPIIGIGTFMKTGSLILTLVVSGGFLLGGFMFGPDLDIYSRQYQRWGWFRWIWIPYQQSLRHRAFLSHGPLIGTAVRLVYLGCWLWVISVILLAIIQIFTDITIWRHKILSMIVQSFLQYSQEWLALYLGLELGAMSHTLLDWGGSGYQQFHKKMTKGFLSSHKSPLVKSKKKPSSQLAPPHQK